MKNFITNIMSRIKRRFKPMQPKQIDYVYYFAYGSNTLQKRIEQRIGYVINMGAISIKGYKLAFNYGNAEQSYANLVFAPNSRVTGVLYKITQRQLWLLDGYEGQGNPKYYHRITEQIMFNEQELTVNLYISFNTRPELFKPVTPLYLSFLINGYTENNIPLDPLYKLI